MTIAATDATLRLRAVLDLRRREVFETLSRFGATNPRVFGSVARGDARDDSDLDLLVDLMPGEGNELLRVAGLGEELSELLGVRVDVVAPGLLRGEVSATAQADAVAVRVGQMRSGSTTSALRSRCMSYREHLDSEELGSMAYDATLRNLAVIGEAVRSLPPQYKLERDGIPWSSIAGLRNVVVHEYFLVDRSLIRGIVEEQLKPLLDELG